MVQFPEHTPEDFPARRGGFETIADIGKERIRRVVARMGGGGDSQLPLDLHPDEYLDFKVFKLAPSTFRQWELPEEQGPEALERQLSFFDRGLEEEPIHST
jgi:adenine-specific DNA-methyltransferase